MFDDSRTPCHHKKVSQYHKNPKISDTGQFAVINLKVEQYGFFLE